MTTTRIMTTPVIITRTIRNKKNNTIIIVLMKVAAAQAFIVMISSTPQVCHQACPPDDNVRKRASVIMSLAQCGWEESIHARTVTTFTV